jgi:hypothetical protein
MKNDDLDRILSKDQEINPSSGFVSSVMNAVNREAATPPPIPFPWKRALPGLCATGVALVSVFAIGVILFMRGTAIQTLPSSLLSTFAFILEVSRTVGVSWVVLALILSFASVKLSMRFTSGKS